MLEIRISFVLSMWSLSDYDKGSYKREVEKDLTDRKEKVM